MPFAGRGPAKRAPKVYDDLQDLIDYIFVSAISEARRTFFASEAESTEAIRLLETLHKVAGSTVRSITTSASCCALSHDDLGDTDVIVNERTGEVSGIVDWEFHSVVPRVMAAHYPSWLRYDGVCDPKYAAEGKWWLSSREESVQMLALFEEVVKSKSQDYHDALFSGTGLRSILEWIYEMGSANYWDRLRRWMAARRMPLHEEKPAVHRQRSATFAL
ncbi:uncharacterized protein PHACADRAFT_177794 [Phanerochaete carnosa HHB-10118-sp]|uniref:Aminoglycoside phosphotransferase domain-containing protein n=1 Tax=Phanerochaete carnosa (strain HHB-10118-sp) TaxID=650164 RepID=K5VW96_PHACS|nr:uncharacterized protein PHACADRAFT_177794 [Phanerochaete carnosa HHB-10118-sp]EKM51100.1 hypothetical protein PHACADRAFT_177794 [Phanerochaete carnosa HHB-10118-sp]